MTFSGRVVAIYLAPESGAPVQPVDGATAVPGRGLEGDRYFDGGGTYSGEPGEGREVTLVEQEAIEAAAQEDGIDLSGGATRRNVVTEGVPLNHLVGREFRVGDVVLRGVRLCEPCSYLAGLTDKRVPKTMLHRCGLRADIVDGGRITVGDEIRPA